MQLRILEGGRLVIMLLSILIYVAGMFGPLIMLTCMCNMHECASDASMFDICMPRCAQSVKLHQLSGTGLQARIKCAM